MMKLLAAAEKKQRKVLGDAQKKQRAADAKAEKARQRAAAAAAAEEARLAEAKAAKAAKEAKEAKEKRAREAAEQLRRDKATDASSSNKRSPPSSSDEEKEKEKRKRRKYNFVCYEGDEVVPRNSAKYQENLEQLLQVSIDVKADLEDLGRDPEDYAVLLWNYDSHKLLPHGASQEEVLGRLVRWWEGFVGMPIRRVEAADFVEPWDRLGAHALDWLYQMSLLNITVNRLWPPKDEAINRVLLRQVSRMARAKAQDLWSSPKIDRPPRLVVVMSEDLCFDMAIEDAQRAGISAVWMGSRGNGAFYPANTTHRMPFVTVPWKRWSQEIGMANRNPFLEGVHAADNPLPSELAHTQKVPMDLKWGKSDELDLDNFEHFIKPQEQPESKEEVDLAAK
eukprot:symbB.v1.2.021500.t1/scaffold1806.1/size131321/15